MTQLFQEGRTRNYLVLPRIVIGLVAFPGIKMAALTNTFEDKTTESDALEKEKLRIPEYMYLEDTCIVEIKEISRGSFGVVKKVSWNGTPCAAKSTHSILSEKGDDRDNYILRQYSREAYQWAVELRHPNIVQFLGLWKRTEDTAIVMELLYVDLAGFLKNHKTLKDAIPMEFTRSIAVDVCRAFTYLERMNVIHRDLKANNVLLTSHFVAKVSDFGAARLYDSAGMMTKDPGNKYYAAPEASGEDYGPEVDVFSFGCLLIEMLIYEFPMPKSNQTLTEYKRREHLLESLKPPVYDEFQPLIEECLSDDPQYRPMFADLLKRLSSKPFITEDERYEIMNAELDSLKVKEPVTEVSLPSFLTCMQICVQLHIGLS